MAQIRVEALDKSFGAFHAVKAASFTVEDGQFLCLLGPSGCGKTTTLRMIAGLELPTTGLIRLGGEDVTMNRASARDIAFVFQLFALYPHMDVRRNIGFPLKCQGVSRAEIAVRVKEAARTLRIPCVTAMDYEYQPANHIAFQASWARKTRKTRARYRKYRCMFCSISGNLRSPL